MRTLALLLLLASALANAAAAGRPNILFCIADDWAWPHALGDKVARTPNIDRLARGGIALERALCGKRPAGELYHLPDDPAQTNNVAALPRFQSARAELRKKLEEWMRRTGDPRLDPEVDPWSGYAYFGGRGPEAARPKK